MYNSCSISSPTQHKQHNARRTVTHTTYTKIRKDFSRVRLEAAHKHVLSKPVTVHDKNRGTPLKRKEHEKLRPTPVRRSRLPCSHSHHPGCTRRLRGCRNPDITSTNEPQDRDNTTTGHETNFELALGLLLPQQVGGYPNLVPYYSSKIRRYHYLLRRTTRNAQQQPPQTSARKIHRQKENEPRLTSDSAPTPINPSFQYHDLSIRAVVVIVASTVASLGSIFRYQRCPPGKETTGRRAKRRIPRNGGGVQQTRTQTRATNTPTRVDDRTENAGASRIWCTLLKVLPKALWYWKHVESQR